MVLASGTVSPITRLSAVALSPGGVVQVPAAAAAPAVAPPAGADEGLEDAEAPVCCPPEAVVGRSSALGELRGRR